jgi:hypothetical protein
LIQKISEEEENLKTRQEKELGTKLEELENITQAPKPSMETLNTTKILEQAIKRKEYYMTYNFIFIKLHKSS